MLVPRELASGVAARLSKFVLAGEGKNFGRFPGVGRHGHRRGSRGCSRRWRLRRDEEDRPWICVGPSRWLVLSRSGQPYTGADEPLSADDWRRLDIAAGIPQVYATTSEAFVAQMLNLDVLDGIAFDKGCYTGQEVIARAHYRGKVKRRMQRFRTHAPAKLNPGDSGTLLDGRTFKVAERAARRRNERVPGRHADDGWRRRRSPPRRQPTAAPLNRRNCSALRAPR